MVFNDFDAAPMWGANIRNPIHYMWKHGSILSIFIIARVCTRRCQQRLHLRKMFAQSKSIVNTTYFIVVCALYSLATASTLWRWIERATFSHFIYLYFKFIYTLSCGNFICRNYLPFAEFFVHFSFNWTHAKCIIVDYSESIRTLSSNSLILKHIKKQRDWQHGTLWINPSNQ